MSQANVLIPKSRYDDIIARLAKHEEKTNPSDSSVKDEKSVENEENTSERGKIEELEKEKEMEEEKEGGEDEEDEGEKERTYDSIMADNRALLLPPGEKPNLPKTKRIKQNVQPIKSKRQITGKKLNMKRSNWISI